MKHLKCGDARTIPGGVRHASLRKATGSCEICGTEYQLTWHHIIPRSEGGLDDAENLAVLCKPCHDEIEGRGYRTREELRLHVPSRDCITPKDEAAKKPGRAALLIVDPSDAKTYTRESIEELRAWCEAQNVGFVGRDEPEPNRPEKLWHVLVYGGGRATYQQLLSRGSE